MRTNNEANPSEQVTTIILKALPRADQWEVRVSVVFDGLYDQGKRLIAKRHVQLGENATLDELSEVGLLPFAVSVVERKLSPVLSPELVNNLGLIAAAELEVGVVPYPHVVTVKNLSDKDIQTLQIDISRGGRLAAESTPTGSWDKPLIKAHGSQKIRIPSDLSTPGATDPCINEQRLSIKFVSAIFADHTFEGEPYWAASQKAADAGSGVQLDKVLRVIEAAQSSNDSDPAQIVRQMKEAARALDETVPTGTLQGLNNAFPSLNDPESNLISHARFGMDKVKCDLLDDLKIFDRLEAAKLPETLPDWLKKEKVKYERWRATPR
jgi:hypothetical protein